MRSLKLARRYAEAIGQLAYEKDELDRVREDFHYVLSVMEEHPGLRRALADQNIPDDTKDELVTKIFEQRLSRISLNFIRLVVSRRRGQYLDDMIQAFFAYADEKQGLLEVEITAASPLGPTDEEVLIKRLSEVMGKDVKLLVKEDDSLLGGVIARVGDLVMDGSVKTRLDELRESLLKAQLN